MSYRPTLTPQRFDAIAPGPENLWGLECIARAIGRSVSTTRRLARRPDVPIHQPAGAGYYASRTELREWLRGKA